MSNKWRRLCQSLLKVSPSIMDMLPWILVSGLLVSVVTGLLTVLLVKGME
ncbi:hypothetical protein K6Q96_16440 [Grimontia kaedaensis]|uniref:Uncharacterized protein n=1 Tax=Grimontia kaedaensis TaxID=2872157 RepID=A0ABY4WUY4_9GAMM|nr:hypothetical protein [Grimontia kaedaensis]USH02404.1 hypothetical protein K6Q96_16440 [Grimontia kaedaensis]